MNPLILSEKEVDMGADLEQEVEEVVEQAEVRMRNRAGSFFLGMLVGAVVAGGVALLFAPQSGTYTRAAWKGRAEQARGKFQEGINNVRERVGRMRKSMQSGSESMSE
jgi:hypothetical protein